MGRLSRILSHWTAVSATALFVCVGVSGHELGTVGVDASFASDGTYSIQILVDVEHLQIGLGPDASLNSVIPGVSPEIADRFGIFLREYIAQSMLAFDWKQVKPSTVSVSLGPKPGAPPEDARPFLELRLSGPIPRGAQKFIWSNSSRVGIYLLTLHQGGDETVTRQFLEARQESNPYRLRPDVVPPTMAQELAGYWPVVLGAAVPIGFILLFRGRRRNRSAAI